MQTIKSTQKELLKAIKRVGLAVPGQTTLPIFRNILIQPGKQIALSATNLNFSITSKVKGKSTLEEPVLIPAKQFRSFVSEVEGEVEIIADWEEIILKSGCHQMRLRREDYADYPPLPTVESDKPIRFIDLADCLKKIAWNMSRDLSRPVLHATAYTNGNLVAADGFTLGVVKPQVESLFLDETVIIPRDAIMAIIKMGLNTATMTVQPKGTLDLVEVKTDDVSVIATCVQGTYPDFSKQTLATYPEKITVDSKTLLMAVKIAEISDAGPVTKFVSDDNGLMVTRDDKEYGVSTQSSIEGHGHLQTAINTTYLVNALSHCKGNIDIKSTNVSSPVEIEQGNCKWIIMPMFVQW